MPCLKMLGVFVRPTSPKERLRGPIVPTRRVAWPG